MEIIYDRVGNVNQQEGTHFNNGAGKLFKNNIKKENTLNITQKINSIWN